MSLNQNNFIKTITIIRYSWPTKKYYFDLHQLWTLYKKEKRWIFYIVEPENHLFYVRCRLYNLTLNGNIIKQIKKDIFTYPRCALRTCSSIWLTVMWETRHPFHVHWKIEPFAWKWKRLKIIFVYFFIWRKKNAKDKCSEIE